MQWRNRTGEWLHTFTNQTIILWGKSNPSPIWSLHMSPIWRKWSQKYRCSNNSIQSASKGCGGFSDDERPHIYGVEDIPWHQVQKPYFSSELPYIPTEVMTHFGFVLMSNCEVDFDWEKENSTGTEFMWSYPAATRAWRNPPCELWPQCHPWPQCLGSIHVQHYWTRQSCV